MFGTRTGPNYLPIFTPLRNLWNLCSLRWCKDVSPAGCLLVRPDSYQPTTTGGADSFGWVVMSRRGRVAASLGARELISQMRMKISERKRRRKGGSLAGAVWKYEESATRCWLAATEASKQDLHPTSLFPPHFKIFVSLLFKTIYNLIMCRSDSSIYYNFFTIYNL